MPLVNTHGDAVRVYLTGAASDGDAQANPDLSLGHYRSSTNMESARGVRVHDPIPNINVLYADRANGIGIGALTATGDDTLAWTPPNGSQGSEITILNGASAVIEGAGDRGAFLLIERTSADALFGSASVVVTENINNAVGGDNVSSAEALAGDDEYRALMLKNVSSSDVADLSLWIDTLGTQRTSDTAQLAASGADTIETGTANGFADWPEQGYVHIKTRAGATREIAYYASRTATVLTVPAAGRGLLGTSAGAGAADDTVDAVPGVRIAHEAPGSQPTGNIQTIANESTSPTGRTWKNGTTEATGVSVGVLKAGYLAGIWIHREAPAGMFADAFVLNKIRLQYGV